MEGIRITFGLEILVGLDEPRDERPRERGEPLVPAEIGGDAAEHVAEEVLLGVHRGGAPVVPVEQLGRAGAGLRNTKRSRPALGGAPEEARMDGERGGTLTAKAEKEVDGAPGRRSQAGLSSARSSPFLARPACPAATVGRSTPAPAAATRSADASRRSRSPSATLPARLLTPRAGADDIVSPVRSRQRR